MSNLVSTTATETDYLKALRQIGDRKQTSATTSTEVTVKETVNTTVPVSVESRVSLARLSTQIPQVEFPTTRRELKPAEVEKYMEVFRDIQGAEAATKAAREAVRTSIYNHMDLELEDDGGFKGHLDLPNKDAKGFYVNAQKIGVEGSNYEFSREVKNPAPVLPVAGLKQLWDEGKISREAYYRMTRKVPVPREVDEDGVTAELARNPQLAAVLAEVVVRPAPTTSLNLRKKEKKA